MSSSRKSVIVIGGGIAGLAAAAELCGSGREVHLLEARERFGGRIHTIRSGRIPVELGAEFIHGRSKPLWKLIRKTKLATHEVPDKHWQIAKDGSLERHDFWEELEKVLGQIDPKKADESFKDFLRHAKASDDLKELATDFVEGFNAARADRISVRALAQSEATSEEIDGTSQFRIEKGYGALIDWLVKRIRNAGTILHLGAEVKVVRWKPGCVEVGFVEAGRARMLRASAAVVTLPLGVLKAGRVRFEPALKQKREVIEGLEFGAVTKIMLRFRRRFWPEANFGFVHSLDEWLPTWWSDPRGNVLTGWAGGPTGEKLGKCPPSSIVKRAVARAASIFGEKPGRALLLDAQTHSWVRDRFSLGAYSYAPVGMSDAPKFLGEPLGKTLFFAGEATSEDGQLGTVHGALESGLRAARLILQAHLP